MKTLAPPLHTTLHLEFQKGKKIGSLIVFSEYRPHPPTIVLYENMIQEFAKEKSIAYYLAHELFHHFEAQGWMQVPLATREEREKAAHQFAIELCYTLSTSHAG